MGVSRLTIVLVLLVAACGADTPTPTAVVVPPIVPVTPVRGTSGYYCRVTGATTLYVPPCRSGDSLVFIVTRP